MVVWIPWIVSMVLGSSGDWSAEEVERTRVVEARKYSINNEINVGLGIAPTDAFYKGVILTTGFTTHLSELWAWEVINAGYSFNLKTSLRDRLENDFNAEPEEFSELKFFGNSSAVFKPMYGKFSLLKNTLLYGEIFLTGGLGLAYYTKDGTSIGPQLGIGARVFLNKTLSIRTEVRDFQFFPLADLSATKNELMFIGSVGLSL